MSGRRMGTATDCSLVEDISSLPGTPGTVRFVGVPGGGMEDVFPSSEHNIRLSSTRRVARTARSNSGYTNAASGKCGEARSPTRECPFPDDAFNPRDAVETAGDTCQRKGSTLRKKIQQVNKSSDCINKGSRRSRTAFMIQASIRRFRRKGPSCKSPPPWEPETSWDMDNIPDAPEDTDGNEKVVRERIRDAIGRIESISGSLTADRRVQSEGSGQGEETRADGEESMEGDATRGSRAARFPDSRRERRKKGMESEKEASIAGLHGSLKVSLDLVTAGEKHASASTAAMADMSEWLGALGRKQMINIRQEEAIEADSMAGIVLAEGIGISECIREYSELTSVAYKRLTSIFKNAAVENERGTRELLARLASASLSPEEIDEQSAVDARGDGDSARASMALGTIGGKRPREVERIKLLQEKQLEEAARSNEEAQALIDELKLSLSQLETRCKQADSMITSLSKNRQKDALQWKALALEYEMKIRYLERALAQEESKLRIAEQVHREEGLELHLEMATKQRSEARAGSRKSSLQVGSLNAKLSELSTRLNLEENARSLLEHDLASERGKYRKLKAQLSAQGKEGAEALSDALESHIKDLTEKLGEAETKHGQALAAASKELADAKEDMERERVRMEHGMKLLQDELVTTKLAEQGRGVGNADSYTDRLERAEANEKVSKQELERIKHEEELEKEAAEEVLQHTVQDFTQKLSEVTQLKSSVDERNDYLEGEVVRLAARCKELVGASEITNEERRRIESAMRQQHRETTDAMLKESVERLARAEGERTKLLSRVLEAEAEAERHRRAAEEITLVLEQEKSAQAALAAAEAAERAETASASTSATSSSRPSTLGESRAGSQESRGAKDPRRSFYPSGGNRPRTSVLQVELSAANQRVFQLEKDLDETRRLAREAEEAVLSARQELERVMDEASCEPTEAQTIQSTATAPTDSLADGDAASTEVLPEEVEEEVQVSTTAARQGSECLKPLAEPRNREAENEIEACLQAAKSKADLLEVGWQKAQGKKVELENKLQVLTQQKGQLREQIHAADCQVQRMQVERAATRRHSAKTAEMLAQTEALLQEVTGSLDRDQHGQTYVKVVDALSTMRKRNADDRAVKLARAREMIERENQARITKWKVLDAMGRSRNGRHFSDESWSHFCPLLDAFLRPGFLEKFVWYAREKAAEARASAPVDALTLLSPNAHGGAAGIIPPRRAMSLGYAATRPPLHVPFAGDALTAVPSRPGQASCEGGYRDPTLDSALPLAPGLAPEARRRANFGDGPPGSPNTKRGLQATERLAGTPGKPGVLDRSRSGEGNGKKAITGKGLKWRVHGGRPEVDLTVSGAVHFRGESRGSGGFAAGGSRGSSRSWSSGGTEIAESARSIVGGWGEDEVSREEAERAEAAAKAAMDRVVELREAEDELKAREEAVLEKKHEEEATLGELEQQSRMAALSAQKAEEDSLERQRLEDEAREFQARLAEGRARLEELMCLADQTAIERREIETAQVEAIEAAEIATAASASATVAVGLASEADSGISRGSSRPSTNSDATKRPGSRAYSSASKRRRVSSMDDAVVAGGIRARGQNDPDGLQDADEELVLHPMFKMSSQAAKKVEVQAMEALNVACEAGEMAEMIEALEMRDVEGDDQSREPGFPGKEGARQAEIDLLMAGKAKAIERLTGVSVQSVVVAMELSLEAQRGLAEDESEEIKIHRQARQELQRNLTSADIVEVSVTLAEAMVLDREGAALQVSREGVDTGSSSRAIVDLHWNDEKAAANKRRIDILSGSLLANEIHDLQVLRSSLVRQSVEEAQRPKRKPPGIVDREAELHADLLRQRVSAVSRAVEKKGGWRSAVFGDDGEVDVGVDVQPWPTMDGVRMLQMVKSALIVQLEESRTKVETLEEAMRSTEEDSPAAQLEAAAKLHLAIKHLWAGVEKVATASLSASPEETAKGPDPFATTSDSCPTSSLSPEDVWRMLKEDAERSIPVDLGCIPVGARAGVLSVDADRVMAASDFLVAAGMLAVSSASSQLQISPQGTGQDPGRHRGSSISENSVRLETSEPHTQDHSRHQPPVQTQFQTQVQFRVPPPETQPQDLHKEEDMGNGQQGIQHKQVDDRHREDKIEGLQERFSLSRDPSNEGGPEIVGKKNSMRSPSSRTGTEAEVAAGDSLVDGAGTECSDRHPVIDAEPPSVEADGGNQGDPSPVSPVGSEDGKIRVEDKDGPPHAHGGAVKPPIGARPSETVPGEVRVKEEEADGDLDSRMQPGGDRNDDEEDDHDDGDDDDDLVRTTELHRARNRARAMEEMVHSLREVADERGVVIGQLKRDVGELEAALAEAQTRRGSWIKDGGVDAADTSNLEHDLEAAVGALRLEKESHADTTKRLDTSLGERERLQSAIEEAKAKELELERLLAEVSRGERPLLSEQQELLDVKSSEGDALKELDAQILDPEIDVSTLEELRSKRGETLSRIAETNNRLEYLDKKHEDMWGEVMKSYKWVHHLPQISVRNRTYASIEEWILAELAEQQAERRRLEREERLQPKRPQGLQRFSSQRRGSSWERDSLLGNLGRSRRGKTPVDSSNPSMRVIGGGYDSAADAGVGSPAQREARAAKVASILAGRSSGDLRRHSVDPGRKMPISSAKTGVVQSPTKADPPVTHSQSQSSQERGMFGIPDQPSPTVKISLPFPVPDAGATSPSLRSEGSGRGASHVLNEAGSRHASPPEGGVRTVPSDSRQRYQSLFTEVPTGLPESMLVASGGKDGFDEAPQRDQLDELSLGSDLVRQNSKAGLTGREAGVGGRGGGRGGGGRSGAGYASSQRRALTPKIDYHNSVRRGSSSVTFKQTPGNPHDLQDFVVLRRNTPKGREDARGVVSSPVPATAKATKAVSPRHAKASEWIFPDSGSVAGMTHPTSGGALPGRGSPRGIRSPVAKRAGSHRMASTPLQGSGSRRYSPGGSTNSTFQPGNGGSAIGSLADSTGLPRQLAMLGGLHGDQGGGLFEDSTPHGRTLGMSGDRAHETSLGAELNHLHPAWKPKGLKRRQRAYVMVERG